MSNEQEHTPNSAGEDMPRKTADAARDERIAPQAARGQEHGASMSAGSGTPTRSWRRVALTVLAVLAVAAACACGVFACTVGAQDPMPIEAGQTAGEAAEGGVGDTASTDAAAAEGSASGDEAESDKSTDNNGTTADSKKAAKDDGASQARNSNSSKVNNSSGGATSTNSSAKNAGNSTQGSKSNKHGAASSNKISVIMTIDGSRAGSQDSASAQARKITVSRGSSVYDVLVASGVSIQGDATYVRSISGLAEFQCGGGSGWMYSVDGVFPNVSCGQYQLKGGEHIVWAYTLNMGEDVK